MKRFAIGKWMAACACVAAAAAPLGAETLSPEEALARLRTTDSARRVAGNGERMRLAHTAECEDTQAPAFYVFDKPSGGYLIVSADDRLATLLADVDEGNFDLDALPDNARWWLGEYTREIGHYLSVAVPANIGEKDPAKVRLKDTRSDVAPMLTTKWAQQYPYNLKCPLTKGTYSATGCVATATAQILNYHRWPESHGFGTHSYSVADGRSYTYDFSEAFFDWDNMLDSYSGSTSQSQKDAVALLMLASGMAVDMDYGNSESSAHSYCIPSGLQDYLGYASSTSIATRDTYSLWEWEELIYQEIAGGRPVNYGGIGDGGGHQFVADGYRADNLFHINWGWAGKSDGYFRLTALDPPALGTGGGSGGFNYHQSAIVGCCPPDKAEGLVPVSPLYINGQMSVENQSTSGIYTSFKLNFEGGGIFAYVTKTLQGQFGMMMTDELDNVVGCYGNGNMNFPAADLEGVSGFRNTYVRIPETPEGRYRLHPAYKAKGGEWQRVPVYNGMSRYLDMTVDSNLKMSFTASALKTLPELEIADLVVPESIERGDLTRLTVEAYNGDAPYNGPVRMFLAGVTEGEADVCVASHDLEMKKNTDTTFVMDVTLDVQEGDHKVYFADCLNRRISSDFNIKVTDSNAYAGLTGAEDNTGRGVYDLQGRRLSALPDTPGVYIVKSGDKTHKVVVTR